MNPFHWLQLFSMIAMAPPPPLINLDRVSPVVKERLVQSGIDRFTDTSQFELSCLDDAFDFASFSFNHVVFEVNANADIIWETYLSADPRTAWNGKSIRYDFAYSKSKNAVYYREDSAPELEVGTGFFLILKLYGLKKIPVGIEISKIDRSTKTLEYTYLEKNVSHGKQSIQFIEDGKNRTRIVHDTYFRSGNRLRDKLYPSIHENLIHQFHTNVLKLLDLAPKRIE